MDNYENLYALMSSFHQERPMSKPPLIKKSKKQSSVDNYENLYVLNVIFSSGKT